MATLADRISSVQNAQSENSPTLGGATVADATARTIAFIEKSSAFRKLSRPIDMPSNVTRVPRQTTPPVVTPTAEAQAISVETVDFAEVVMTLEKHPASQIFTNELIDDGNGALDASLQEMASALGKNEDEVALGHLTADAPGAWTSTVASASAITAGDLVAMIESVVALTDGNQAWAMNSTVFGSCLRALSTAGFTTPSSRQLLTFPVVTSAGFAPATSATSGDVLAVFGDWSSIGFGAKSLELRVLTELLADTDRTQIVGHDRRACKLLQTERQTLAILEVA